MVVFRQPSRLQVPSTNLRLPLRIENSPTVHFGFGHICNINLALSTGTFFFSLSAVQYTFCLTLTLTQGYGQKPHEKQTIKSCCLILRPLKSQRANIQVLPNTSKTTFFGGLPVASVDAVGIRVLHKYLSHLRLVFFFFFGEHFFVSLSPHD